MNNLLITINNRISTLQNSERTTRIELAAISRELLVYVPDSKDVDAVNRLIDVLTPMNKATAILFFREFLPWKFDEKNSRFGEMFRGKNEIKTKLENIKDFLSHEENNIWLWAQRNIKLEQKKTAFEARISSLVGKALKGEKGLAAIDKLAVISAVMAGGISAGDLINVMEEAKAAFEARQKEENEKPLVEKA